MRRRAEEHDLSPVWSSSLSQQHKHEQQQTKDQSLTKIFVWLLFELLLLTYLRKADCSNELSPILR